MTNLPLLDELWREQSVLSQTANRMKAGIDRARLAALIIVVLVAVSATAATAVHDVVPWLGRLLAGVAAAGSAVLPTLRSSWSGKKLKDWTRARSVSEAFKSDVYLWLAKAGPFEHDAEATELRARTDKLRADAADLTPPRLGIQPVPRELPTVHGLLSFFKLRVEGQITDYYVKKVDLIGGRLKRFRGIEIGLGLLGAGLGVIAAAIGASFASWIAVVATIGTALAVHVAATRYEFQLIEFSRTAEELRRIKNRADLPGISDNELRELAVRAEEVISVENQGWMAKLAEDPPRQKALED